MRKFDKSQIKMSRSNSKKLQVNPRNDAYVRVEAIKKEVESKAEEVKSSQECKKIFIQAESVHKQMANLKGEDKLIAFAKVLYLYNKALRFALSDDDFARIYKKRSQISVALTAYQSAICNIELMLSYDPANTSLAITTNVFCHSMLDTSDFGDAQLKKLFNICEGSQNVSDTYNNLLRVKREKNENSKLMTATNVDRGTLKLSRKAHPKIPWIANCLELKEDVENGKYIITTEDLKVGDIIAVDKPLHASSLALEQGKQCIYCLNSSPLTMIPCPGCTSGLYFVVFIA